MIIIIYGLLGNYMVLDINLRAFQWKRSKKGGGEKLLFFKTTIMHKYLRNFRPLIGDIPGLGKHIELGVIYLWSRTSFSGRLGNI